MGHAGFFLDQGEMQRSFAWLRMTNFFGRRRFFWVTKFFHPTQAQGWLEWGTVVFLWRGGELWKSGAKAHF